MPAGLLLLKEYVALIAPEFISNNRKQMVRRCTFFTLKIQMAFHNYFYTKQIISTWVNTFLTSSTNFQYCQDVINLHKLSETCSLIAVLICLYR